MIRRIAFLAGLFLLGLSPASVAQERVVVAHRADSVDVAVQSRFLASESEPGEFRYEYEVTSAPSSVQNVWVFEVEVSETGRIGPIHSPSEDWASIFPAWPHAPGEPERAAPWGGLGENGRIRPGETLEGFGFQSSIFPGIVRYWVQGWTPLPVYPDESAMPDSVVNHTLFENSVTGYTIGPWFPPEDVSTIRQTLSAMIDVLDAACVAGWVREPGTCDDLSKQLELASREVDDGRGCAPARRMDRFRTRLDRERDRTLNTQAHRLLTFYLRRLSTLGLD